MTAAAYQPTYLYFHCVLPTTTVDICFHHWVVFNARVLPPISDMYTLEERQRLDALHNDSHRVDTARLWAIDSSANLCQYLPKGGKSRERTSCPADPARQSEESNARENERNPCARFPAYPGSKQPTKMKSVMKDTMSKLNGGYITKIEEVAGGDEALARVCEAGSGGSRDLYHILGVARFTQIWLDPMFRVLALAVRALSLEA